MMPVRIEPQPESYESTPTTGTLATTQAHTRGVQKVLQVGMSD